MAIDDGDRGAQLLTDDGRRLSFDEVGCLLGWLDDDPTVTGDAFVRDEAGTGWIAADSAAYVADGVRTAMGFDIVAYGAADAASTRAASTGGVVLTWDKLHRRSIVFPSLAPNSNHVH